MSSDDFPGQMQRVADMLNTIADQIEPFMAAFREAREALSDLPPDVARFVQSHGSHELLGATAGEGLGYGAVEAARLRLLSALMEPWDNITPKPPPGGDVA